LFRRDAGEQKNRSKKAEDKAEAKQLWEDAYTAYAKALELAPQDPNYLNDIAVMLHYYLNRDLEQALAWYKEAAVQAEKELARTDLSKELRDIRAIAKRDANNNMKKLEELLELRRKKAEKKEGEKPGESQG
jgi:TPR repeat protein